MIRSLLSGLSGIRSNQISLDVIGNNIANINTPSFKGGRASFADTLSMTLRGGMSPSSQQGGLDPVQIGRGAMLGSINTIFTQGSLETTNNPTDLAIAGEGFFVLRHGSENFYTRDGSFDIDANGTLVDPSTGYAVQGRMADSSGNILSSTPITDIVLPIESLFPARATTRLSFTGNLDATADIINCFTLAAQAATITGLDAGTIASELSDAFADNGITLSSNATVTVDTNGERWHITDGDTTYCVESDGANNLTIYAPVFTLSDQAATITELNAGTITALREAFEDNGITLSGSATVAVDTNGERWHITDGNSIYYVEKDGGSNLIIYNSSISETGTYQTSFLAYDSLGDSHNVTVTFARSGSNSWRWYAELPESTNRISQTDNTLTFRSDGSIDSGGSSVITIEGAGNGAGLSNGADALTITVDLSGLVQYATPFTPVPSYRDGHSAGALDSINFDETGTLIGTFTNGATQRLAQVVLADFYNPSGLIKSGENLYSVSMNSGSALIGTAGSSIRASIVPGALEGSNVDLASEFTKMIVAQRGFEANSRLVMTSDAILGELINLKR